MLSMSTAPRDCLQYFTQSSGQVKSFNWKDIAGTNTRHLANQDYKMCFRSELTNSGVSRFIGASFCEYNGTIVSKRLARGSASRLAP